MNLFHRKLFVHEADENPCKEEALNNGVQSRSHDSLLPSTVVVFGLLLGILLGLFYRWRRSNGPSRRISPIRILAARETHEENHNQLQLDQNPVRFINTAGLKQSDIDSITVFGYRKDEGVTEGTECSVCLSEFREDERLKLLPKCNHAFHVACIDTWLRAHKTCPFCRAPIVVSSDAGVVNGSDRLPGNSRNPNKVDHEETGNRNGGCGNSSSRVLSESSSTAVVRKAAGEAEIAELKNPKPKNSNRKKPIMRSFSSARLSSEGHLDMKRSSSFRGMFLKQDLNA